MDQGRESCDQVAVSENVFPSWATFSGRVMPSTGAVRRMRTRLSMAMISRFYAAQSCCHSTRAASRWTLYVSLEFRWRSLLKWLKTDEWIETNFCKLRILLNFNTAYSRRRKGWWEFSHLLFFHRSTSWVDSLPIIFIAARYDFSLSVTITFGAPYFLIILLRKSNAAFRSLRLDTKASRT
jgi:hypothetical protein